MRVKDFTKKVGSGVTPRGGAEVYQYYGVPLFRSQNVTNEGFLLDDIAYISEEIDESMSGTRVKPNDVLLNITGASIGRCYYTPSDFERGNVNQHVCIIRPTKKVIAPYLYYNLISDNGQRQIDLTQTGSNREGLTKENICNFEFEVPSLEIQNSIVSYLDSHVSSIDKRVSLLTTKRDHYLRLKTAIINRAVTQGLNPDVKMKDSGIKGFDFIPLDWRIVRIKDLARLQSGESFTADDLVEDGIYPVYGGNGLRGYSDKYTNRGEFVLIGRQGALCGNINYAKGVFFATEHAIVVYSRQNVVVKWLGETLRILNLNRLSMSAAQPGLSVSIINKQFIPFPPFEEQKAIASYIDEKCAKIDAIVENLNQQIEKHKLLKRALINEVITGQRAV